MLNFAVNKKESRRFVRFYKDHGDKIVTYFGNWGKAEFDSTKEIRDNLNKIEEQQVKDGNNYFTQGCPKLLGDSRQEMGRLFCVYSAFSGAAGLLSIPIASLFNVNNTFGTMSLIVTSNLLILPINNVIKAINLSKYNIFLKNKDKINAYLDYKHRDDFENEIYERATSKKKYKKELCINDIHNLNIFKVCFTSMKANRYVRKVDLEESRKSLVNEIKGKSKIKTII